jgi:hypothetical protein
MLLPIFCSPEILALVFRLETDAEEVEEDFEHREGGHGEDHAQ